MIKNILSGLYFFLILKPFLKLKIKRIPNTMVGLFIMYWIDNNLNDIFKKQGITGVLKKKKVIFTNNFIGEKVEGMEKLLNES